MGPKATQAPGAVSPVFFFAAKHRTKAGMVLWPRSLHSFAFNRAVVFWVVQVLLVCQNIACSDLVAHSCIDQSRSNPNSSVTRCQQTSWKGEVHPTIHKSSLLPRHHRTQRRGTPPCVALFATQKHLSTLNVSTCVKRLNMVEQVRGKKGADVFSQQILVVQCYTTLNLLNLQST